LIGHARVIQPRVLDVTCHAHNCARAEGREPSSDGVPYRLSIGEEPTREIAVDHGYARRTCGVLLGEETALKQGDFHGAKIIWPGEKRL